MNSSNTTVRSYQNFFVKTVSRSLQTAYDSLIETQTFTDDVRDRGTTALGMALKPQIAPTVWQQTRDLLLTMSPKAEESGYWGEWYTYLEDSIKMSITLSDQQAEGAIRLQIGIFQQRQGLFKPAVEWFESVIKCAKEIEDKVMWATGLNRLGLIAVQQHRMAEASDYVTQAMELTPKDDPQWEYSYYVLGWIALNLREYQKAVNYFEQSLEICKQQEDRHQIAVRLDNLGIALHYQGASQAALESFDRSIALLEMMNAPIQLAITKMNQGIVYEGLNEPQKALLYYKEAKPILEKVLNVFNLATLYNNQGFCYYQQKQWEEAERSYQASLSQWRELENWVGYANVLDGLGLVYREKRQLAEAIQTFKDALQILSDRTDSSNSQYLTQEITMHLEETIIRLPNG